MNATVLQVGRPNAPSLAWHDWQVDLKVWVLLDGGMSRGVYAITPSLDAFHPDAFTGTGVKHLIPADPAPRRVVFDCIDWCGNVVGQIDDCPLGPVGTLYDVQGAGASYAFYRVASYRPELLIDGQWYWGVLMTFDQEAYAAAHAEARAKLPAAA